MHASEPTHPSPEQLEAFARSRLGADELAWLAAHLNECPGCCTRLDEIFTRNPLLVQLRGAAQSAGEIGIDTPPPPPAGPAPQSPTPGGGGPPRRGPARPPPPPAPPPPAR